MFKLKFATMYILKVFIVFQKYKYIYIIIVSLFYKLNSFGTKKNLGSNQVGR